MIWFSTPLEALRRQSPRTRASGDDHSRMRRALQQVAAHAPHLAGSDLLDALAATGYVDRETAARLLPWYRDFDADRYFSENLRRLSFRGPSAAEEFRSSVRRALEDVVGSADLGSVGPEEGIRFRSGEREGIVLAYPEVGFSLGGRSRESVAAALEEMPDALVIVARNFQEGTAAQLGGILSGSGVPGTLVTVNLLLGIRAVAIRYQPGPERVIATLGAGRLLRSTDVALLGNRE